MPGEDQKLIESLCRIISLLPESKREWLMGFGEGMAFAKEGNDNAGDSNESVSG